MARTSLREGSGKDAFTRYLEQTASRRKDSQKTIIRLEQGIYYVNTMLVSNPGFRGDLEKLLDEEMIGKGELSRLDETGSIQFYNLDLSNIVG